MIVEPTSALCDMFYNKSLLGAWECGKFSAEYRLKGIQKVLAKLGTPQVWVDIGVDKAVFHDNIIDIKQEGRCKSS
jgi:hypothetical protein